jgi:hypothetical protein
VRCVRFIIDFSRQSWQIFSLIGENSPPWLARNSERERRGYPARGRQGRDRRGGRELGLSPVRSDALMVTFRSRPGTGSLVLTCMPGGSGLGRPERDGSCDLAHLGIPLRTISFRLTLPKHPLGHVIAPEIGGAEVAERDLGGFVPGLAHQLGEAGALIAGGGGEAGAQ